MNDSELDNLIRRCRKGKSEAFSELVDVYGKKCWGYFFRLTGNKHLSDDLLSELFLKLLEKIKSYKTGNFNQWLFTVTANIFRDHLRTKYRDQKLTDKITARAQIENSSQPKAEPEIFDKLHSKLQMLDPETRELIVMRFYGEFSFKELAEIRQEPVGTTLSKVHRGIAKLKELMENENE